MAMAVNPALVAFGQSEPSFQIQVVLGQSRDITADE
jgi:hypothetical protein